MNLIPEIKIIKKKLSTNKVKSVSWMIEGTNELIAVSEFFDNGYRDVNSIEDFNEFEYYTIFEAYNNIKDCNILYVVEHDENDDIMYEVQTAVPFIKNVKIIKASINTIDWSERNIGDCVIEIYKKYLLKDKTPETFFFLHEVLLDIDNIVKLNSETDNIEIFCEGYIISFIDGMNRKQFELSEVLNVDWKFIQNWLETEIIYQLKRNKNNDENPN